MAESPCVCQLITMQCPECEGAGLTWNTWGPEVVNCYRCMGVGEVEVQRGPVDNLPGM